MPLFPPVPTFTVYDKATGRPMLADTRTFNPLYHSTVDPAAVDESPAVAEPVAKSPKGRP